MITRFFSACADLLWPRQCAGCEAVLQAPSPEPGSPFCADCRVTLSPLDPGSTCPRCAAPLLEPGRCADCRLLKPCLARIQAAYEYGGALADALVRCKWRGRDDLGAPLGGLLAPVLRSGSGSGSAGAFDLVVPVPLHPRRLRQRGYNQATLLARAALAKAGLALPLLPVALLRVRGDPPARGLGKQERFTRMRGAFAVHRSIRGRLAGKRVLLIDDVVTTGATAQACAMALIDAGAARVEALALLRAG